MWLFIYYYRPRFVAFPRPRPHCHVPLGVSVAVAVAVGGTSKILSLILSFVIASRVSPQPTPWLPSRIVSLLRPLICSSPFAHRVYVVAMLLVAVISAAFFVLLHLSRVEYRCKNVQPILSTEVSVPG
jgi:hypothetical protein